VSARLKVAADLMTSCVSSEVRPFVALEHLESGTGRLVADSEFPERTAPDTGAASVESGDVLFGKLRPYLAKTWLADRPVFASTELLCLRPRAGIESRWLAYLVTGSALVEWAVASSDGTKMPRTSWEKIAEYRINIPPLERQRLIADYLDAETGRIDALIAKRRRMIELLNERYEGVVEQSMRMLVEGHGAIPLKHAAIRVEVGIVVTPASWYADAGVIALRGLNIKPGNIVLDDVVRISPEGHQLHRKSALKQGDIVVVRTGQAGTAAVVPAELDGCNCIDLVIIRPSARIMPKFLEFVLNSDWTQKHIDEHSVGTIQNHFNVGAMKGVPIPLPSLREQADVADALSHEAHKIHKIVDKLGRQIALLQERRQALITAAVSGEIGVPGLAA
jgi:type I restriction enzyme S subunit